MTYETHKTTPFPPKTHQLIHNNPLGGQIAGYSPHFWMKNARPKLHWVNAAAS